MSRAWIALSLAVCAPGCGKTDETPACPSADATGPMFGALTCATTALPDELVGDTFDIDTGLPQSTAGANYGQAACKDQYLVEVDLTQSAYRDRNHFVNGGWSTQVPPRPCEKQAVMSAFTFDGRCWRLFDQMQYVGDPHGTTICHALAQSHTNSSQQGLSGIQIGVSQFQRLRFAINATEGGVKAPILLVGAPIP